MWEPPDLSSRSVTWQHRRWCAYTGRPYTHTHLHTCRHTLGQKPPRWQWRLDPECRWCRYPSSIAETGGTPHPGTPDQTGLSAWSAHTHRSRAWSCSTHCYYSPICLISLSYTHKHNTREYGGSHPDKYTVGRERWRLSIRTKGPRIHTVHQKTTHTHTNRRKHTWTNRIFHYTNCSAAAASHKHVYSAPTITLTRVIMLLLLITCCWV